MKKDLQQKIKKLLRDRQNQYLGLVIILILLFIGAIAWLVQDAHHKYVSGLLRPQQTHKPNLDVSSISSPDNIQPWMTFDYVNTIFKLPSEYLSTTLQITDTHYPNIQIGRYAKSHAIDRREFLLQVQQAVTTYLTV